MNRFQSHLLVQLGDMRTTWPGAGAKLEPFHYRSRRPQLAITSCVTVCAKALNPLRDSPVVHMTVITVSASYYLFSID
jgi:hypothetical protein